MSILKHKNSSTFLILRMFIFFVYSYTFSQHKYPIKKTLDNGFSYYIQKNSYPAQKTLFYLVVKTGSINENKHQLGYAHFLEHMAFKGGKRFKNKSFTKYLKEQGLEIGINFNAVTNYDYTIYTIEFPKKVTHETLQKTMAFFADILDGLHLNKQQIETEKKIVLEEKRIATPPSKHYNFKLGNSLYLQRLAIGTDSSIHKITQKKLKTFYKQWYQPKNSAVFVVGDIDTTKTKGIIKNIFTSIKNNTSPDKIIDNQLYKHIKSTVFNDTTKNNTKSKVHLEWAIKHEFTSPKKELVKKITTRICNRILQKRFDSLLKKDVKYLSINTNYFLSDVTYTSISYNVKSNIKQSIENVLQEIQRLTLHSISKKELQFHINKELENLDNKQSKNQTSHQIVNASIDEYLGINFTIPKITKEQLKRKILQEITPKNIKEIAKNLKVSSKLRVFIEQSPNKKLNLTLQELEIIKAKVIDKDLKPIAFNIPNKKEVKNDSIFELTIPVLIPKKPKQKENYQKLGITKLQYENGVEVYLKPIKDSSNEIKISGVATGGTSSIPDSLYYQYGFAVSYMELGGIANLNPKQLDVYHEDKDFGVSFTISEFERNVYGYSKTNQIDEFLKYLYLKMTKATVDTLEFNSVIKDEIAALKEKNKITFERKIYNEKVAELKKMYFPKRKSATTEKEYRKLNIFKMQEFYNSAFNHASDWKFIVTGNFSIDAILPSLHIYFGNLEKGKNIKNKELFNKSHFENQLKIPLLNDEKTATTTFLFYSNYQPTIKNSILTSLLKKYVSNKITNTLREEYGLVYTPIVSVEKSIHPKPFSILEIQYSCKPESTEKTKEIVVKTLTKMLKKRLTEEELLPYKKGVLLQYNSIITSNNSHNWNFSLHKSLSNDENIGELGYFPDILYKTSTNDLQSFIKKTIDFKNMKIIYED